MLLIRIWHPLKIIHEHARRAISFSPTGGQGFAPEIHSQINSAQFVVESRPLLSQIADRAPIHSRTLGRMTHSFAHEGRVHKSMINDKGTTISPLHNTVR